MPPRGLPLPRLRELRLRALLSQAQLGEKAGLTRHTIGRLEAGEPATPTSIRKLSRALKVAPEVLMGPMREDVGPRVERAA